MSDRLTFKKYVPYKWHW